MICSTFDLRFNQSPGAVLALTNSRRMGVAYSYRTQYYYLCGGFFTDNDLSNLKMHRKDMPLTDVWFTVHFMSKRN